MGTGALQLHEVLLSGGGEPGLAAAKLASGLGAVKTIAAETGAAVSATIVDGAFEIVTGRVVRIDNGKQSGLGFTGRLKIWNY